MKNKLIALVLTAALALSAIPAAGAAFTDIKDEQTQLAAAALQGFGIVSGTDSQSFAPEGTLTRAQACTMVTSLMGLSSQVSTYARKTLFSDVAASAWYNGYVNLAYSKGVINGYGNGKFGPNDSITYGQLATIVLRLLGYTTAEIGSVWPYDFVAFAEDLELNGGLSLTAEQSLTRGQAAVILYQALKANTASGQPYYQSISGVKSSVEAVLMDVSAAYGGSTGLLMAYTLDGGGIQYYTQENVQSDALCGCVGTLLFDGSGRVVGFVPDSTDYLDLKISSATATTLTAASGTSYRISSGAKVIAGGEVYPYSSTGYLQLNSQAGKTVRLFYDDSGAVNYLYLAGGTTSASQAAVASSASAASLASSLGISGSYQITKNGSAAGSGAVAANDVAYYDAGSNTLRVSDYRVSGFIQGASPSVAAAETLTIAGHTFDVLECAWDSLSSFQIGSKVTLLLTDDNKVAAASSTLSADMIGVLAEDGRSVTLTGSGVALSADKMTYDDACLGSLVAVSATSATAMSCRRLTSGGGGSLSISGGTLGSAELAPSCAVYEWGGSGYVYSLEGEKGAASYDLTAISWTDSLSASSVSYAHTNSAGQIDVLLLNDVTGNFYQYGKVTRYTGSDGINLGGNGGGMDAYNTAAALTNSQGTTAKYLCSVATDSGYTGVALGRYSTAYGRITRAQSLSRFTAGASDFSLRDGDWYVQSGETEYPVAEQVQIHIVGTDLWLSGSDGVTSVLADGYQLTLYYDRAPSQGGQVRVIAAARAS